MEIIPAILTNKQSELIKLIKQIEQSKRFSRVQIDFVDGEYAASKTIKPMEADLIPFFPLKFDAHLMVAENNILEWSLMAKEFGFDRVIAQVESISHPEEFTALALDVHSPVEAIKPYLANLTYIVVMSVEPGFGGQEFTDAAIGHVKELKKFGVTICVDGGIEKQHLQMLEDLGVDEVAVGAKRVLEW